MLWLIILWVFAPAALIPTVIVLAVQNSSLRQELRELKIGRNMSLAEKDARHAKPAQQPDELESEVVPGAEMPPSTAAGIPASVMAGTSPAMAAEAASPANASGMPFPTASIPGRLPAPGTGTGPYRAMPVRRPLPSPQKHKEDKRGLEQAALTVGVILILMAALIFVTTTWNIMPGWIKAFSLLSVGGIFFLASFLAGRILKLFNTSIAFYMLGCFSLPAVLGAVSFFQLWGRWFCASGEGRYALYLSMSGGFTALMALGNKLFGRGFFSMASWLCSIPAAYCLSRFLFPSDEIAQFLTAAYCLGLCTWKWERNGNKCLQMLHPFLWCILINRCCSILLNAGFFQKMSESVWRNIPEILAVLASFFLYWLGKIQYRGKTLRSIASDILFPALLFWWAVLEMYVGRFGAASLAAGGSTACLTFQSWAWKGRGKRDSLLPETEGEGRKWGEEHMIAGTGAIALLWFCFYPLYLWAEEAGLPLAGKGFLIYFTVLTAAGILCIKKRSFFFFVKPMEFPAVITWGIAAVCGLIYSFWYYRRADGWTSALWGIYVWLAALAIWFFRYKKPYCILIYVMSWLLPPFTGAALGCWQDWPSAGCIWLVLVLSSAVCYGNWSWSNRQAERQADKGQESDVPVCCLYMGLVGLCLGTTVIGSLLIDKEDSMLWGLIFLLCMGLSLYITGKEKMSVLTAFPAILILPAVGEMAFRSGKGDRTQICLWAILATGIAMAAIGRIQYPMLADFREAGPGEGRFRRQNWQVDCLSIYAFGAPFTMLVQESPYWSFWGIPLFALFLVNCYGRIGKKGDQILLTVMAGLIPWAFQKVPYWEIPAAWKTEYRIVGFLVFGYLLRYVWDGRDRKYAEWIFFAQTVLAVLAQGIECLWTEDLWDVIALAGAMTAVMVLSYYLKRKRWLLLSFVTLITLVLYQSRYFWLRIQWWVYLMAAGLWLISTAAGYEYKRRSAKEWEEHRGGREGRKPGKKGKNRKKWLEDWEW
ncbi:hypothetical protein AALB16_12270 [Lachnospiraceae bacterium 62-35]